VGESEQVGSPAAPVTDHNRHRRLICQTVQHRADSVATTFHHEADQRRAVVLRHRATRYTHTPPIYAAFSVYSHYLCRFFPFLSTIYAICPFVSTIYAVPEFLSKCWIVVLKKLLKK